MRAVKSQVPGIRLSLVLGLIVFVLDRGHKYFQIEVQGWRGGEFATITPFFDYVLVWNTGISYGMFGELPPAILLAIMGVAMIALTIWWLRADTLLVRCGLALCLGGALSHVIDRWVYRAVPDFFHFHWGEWSFYVFNISDTAITIGVVLLAVDAFWPRAKSASSP